jgi:hypothetical protein
MYDHCSGSLGQLYLDPRVLESQRAAIRVREELAEEARLLKMQRIRLEEAQRDSEIAAQQSRQSSQ